MNIDPTPTMSSDGRPSATRKPKPKRKRVMAIAILLVIVLAATALAYYSRSNAEEEQVAVFAAKRGPLTIDVSVGGTIQNRDLVIVRSQVSRRLAILWLIPEGTSVEKGDLLGWFNMGSTVILLLPEGACEWDDDLRPGETLCMGEEIGELREPLP